jgi:hypothetical protein
MKDQLYRIDGIKHERGAGWLKLRYPNISDKAPAEEIGENFVINEQMYIALPGAKPEAGVPGWDAEIMTAGVGDQSAALMESVRHHDRLTPTHDDGSAPAPGVGVRAVQGAGQQAGGQPRARTVPSEPPKDVGAIVVEPASVRGHVPHQLQHLRDINGRIDQLLQAIYPSRKER